MNICYKILGLKGYNFVFEEDFIDILMTDLGLSLEESISVLRNLGHTGNPTAKIYSIIERLNLSIEDKEAIVNAIIELNFEPFVNRYVDNLFEDVMISMVDTYLRNTNGRILYKIQAQSIISILGGQLPMYFKKNLIEEDEEKINKSIKKSIEMVREDYSRLADVLSIAFSTTGWNNERIYMSYQRHEESIMNEFVRKNI